ncbi:siderophore-interacting protein, partial [Streptomyces werraensis]|uniref:siderophore-interacting protein n=1 Tax=Streptomyces werraensis TaxID=68284 RepID=UPI0036AD3DBF
MTTAVAAPFRSFAPQVAGTRRLGPSPVRVTFTGPELRDVRSDGRDRSLSSPLPRPGRDEPVVPLEPGGSGWQVRRELPDGVRAVLHPYTLRAPRTDTLGQTTGIDLVLRGVTRQAGPSAEAGPASPPAGVGAGGARVRLVGTALADNP